MRNFKSYTIGRRHKSVLVTIHADDMGISEEITENILRCVNKGIVSSASVVCNTPAFDQAINTYKENAIPFKLRLHLNLVEGTPLESGEGIPLLINQNGEFRYTFLSLWLKYSLSGKKVKQKFREQLKIEIDRQICKFRSAIGPGVKIGLDSHTHIHMLPFILDIILDLSERAGITFVRLPKEKFYFSPGDWENYCSLNIVKNLLLNFLCFTQQNKIKARGIETNSYFIGVLATGKMTISSVKKALETLKKKRGIKTVEILFHPGGVEEAGSINWTGKRSFKSYYFSANRKKEAALLKSRELNQLINDYRPL